MKNLVYVLLVFFLVFTTYVFRDYNKNQLEKYGGNSTIKIVEIYSKAKGVTTREKVAKVEYITTQGVRITRVPFHAKMMIGGCYNVRYSKRNIDIIDIDYSSLVPCQDDFSIH